MKNCYRSYLGFTMIELLLSMVLGAFLLGGMLQILMSTKQSYNLQEGLSRIQENGRFALNLVTRDIRMAGFLGCRKIADVIPATTAAPNAPFEAPTNVTLVTGAENIANNWNSNYCGASNGCIAGTDAIRFKHANACGGNLTATMVAVTSAIAIPAANTCSVASNETLMVADCSNSDIFRASSATSTLVSHTTASNGSASLSKAYATDAELLTYTDITYFVRVDTSGGSSLWQYDNTSAWSTTNPQEVVEGIENMQILYGFDTDTPQDGAANYFVPAGTAGINMAQVVSVRVSLLVASNEDNLVATPTSYTFNGVTITPADRKIRRVFTSTVAVRNMLP